MAISRGFLRPISFLLPTLLATAATAQDAPTIGAFGTTGLVDMPSAESQPDGQMSLTASRYQGTFRTQLTFQITPRLSGTFRYSEIDDYAPSGGSYYDRSFDLQYRFMDEGPVSPAMAVGLRDFGGTGIYASEYVVATKHFGEDDALAVTGGIGWGRLGTFGGFSNPLGLINEGFKDRSNGLTGIDSTGRVQFGNFFRGDAALFGGIAWRYSDRLTLKLEYSSDDYSREVTRTGFDHRTPINFGATYRFRNGIDMTGYMLAGSEAGLVFSYGFDPGKPSAPSGLEKAPVPVTPRNAIAAASWDQGVEATEQRVAAGLEAQGILLEGLSVDGNVATLRVRNGTYPAAPEAIGRTARVLTGTLPASVEVFRIIPVVNGIATSQVEIHRTDMEELEGAPDADWQSFVRAQITDAAGAPRPVAEDAYPRFKWRTNGYSSQSLFDPDGPLRVDFGAELNLSAEPVRGLVFSGQFRRKVIGNLDESTRVSDSVLPHVRSDSAEYDRQADAYVNSLTADYFFRPAADWYGRVTVGYLERMYGGVSTEVLWKPVDSRLALGAEMNYARQRDFDGGFGFQDYDVVTGHASAYYDFGSGYLGQVDVGRYLAGDYGATFSLDREFGNGFVVGAFFTLTDVSFEEFGEGSFDKGIRISIPISWLSGEATQDGFGTVIRPILRDGGARLNVNNRLYGLTRNYHDPELQDRWGRFWR